MRLSLFMKKTQHWLAKVELLLLGRLYAELIQAGGEILHSKIHELINSIWNTGKLPDQWKESIIVQFTRRVIKRTVVIIGGITTINFVHNFIEYSSLKAKSICWWDYWGSDVTGQLLIRSFAFIKYWRRNGSAMRQYISAIRRLQEGREVLYNILIEFGVPMKLGRLIKMCLNEMYSKVRIGKHFIIFLPEWSKTIYFIANAFQLCFRPCH
jgi:hypothetical protein